MPPASWPSVATFPATVACTRSSCTSVTSDTTPIRRIGSLVSPHTDMTRVSTWRIVPSGRTMRYTPASTSLPACASNRAWMPVSTSISSGCNNACCSAGGGAASRSGRPWIDHMWRDQRTCPLRMSWSQTPCAAASAARRNSDSLSSSARAARCISVWSLTAATMRTGFPSASRSASSSTSRWRRDPSLCHTR